MATESSAQTGAAPAPAELNEFEALLTKEFKPKTSEAESAVKSAVQTLAEEALKGEVVRRDDVLTYIEDLIAAIDKKLSAQLNLIMHHDDFTKLEGSWRGLHHLVYNSETDTMLKIKVLNISKREIQRTLHHYKGIAFDQSPLFKKIYEEEYGTFGGHPFGCLVGDYEFDHTAQDVQLLRDIAKIASSAHCPFISAASPRLMQMDSWQELSNPRDLAKLFENAEYAAWRSLRDSEDAKYLGLTMPRYLARLPYSTRSNPVDAFAFEEDAEGRNHRNFVWANAAYAMAVNINRAFKLYGWCARIRGVESGGLVQGLPVHTFPTDDGGVDMKCPTEIAITDRRENELAKLGLMPLLHCKNTDYAAFIGAQSLYRPGQYDDPDATANANLSARLPYLFAVCRFAHYLKCIVRDKIGSFKEREDMEKWLNDWIVQYVTDSGASEEMKARYPLAGAEVKVQEDPENPGYYFSQFFLRPHYQLEGLTVSLRLVSKLPSQRAQNG